MVRIFLNSSKGKYHASGEYSAPNVVVLRGSKINMAPPANMIIRPSIQALRQNRTLVHEDGTVLYDISFDTLAKATMFVLGCSDDGLRCWKTEDGVSVGQIGKTIPTPGRTQSKRAPSFTEAPLPTKERGKTPFKRLRTKILREIRRKKFLGDIPISDDEYALLINYCRDLLVSRSVETRLKHTDVCLTLGLVHVGIRYYDSNYWRHAARELNAPDLATATRLRSKVSECISNTLEKYGKDTAGKNETVQTILMHGYISNHYADQYFDFLYAFYRLDLGRNIALMDSDSISALFDSIADDTSARRYMLREQVKDAILANRHGSKLRLRKHLRLIDNYFWNENYRLRSNNRIYTLLQEWVEKNNRFEKERRETGIHHRGKKAFSKPHFVANYQQASFRLYIPAQLLPRDMQAEVQIKITMGDFVHALPAEIVETVTSYRTEPVDIPVPAHCLLEAVSVSLIAANQTVIRTFSIPAEDVRFFDEEGYSESFTGLSKGIYFAYTKPKTQFSCAAVEGHQIIGCLKQWYLDLEDGDIIRLPNSTAVFVGQKAINGLLERGKVAGAQVLYSDSSTRLSVYRTMPELVIRAPKEKSVGILLRINGTRHKVNEANALPFSFNDGTTDVGYYINLDAFGKPLDGKYEINIDIPNGGNRWYSFVLLHNLEVEFDGAPYIFEPRGSVTISCSTQILACSAGCQSKGSNQFDFEIDPEEMKLQFQIGFAEAHATLEIGIPALFWRYDYGSWNCDQPEELWHTELPSCIEIVAPCEKVVLHIDDLEDEDSDVEQKPVVGERRADSVGFILDTTRLKTYLAADQTLRTLYLDMDQLTKRFVQIVTRSTVAQCMAIAHYQENAIEVRASIIGKAAYYADISFKGNLLVEKKSLTDMACCVQVPDGLRSGEYEIELFEDVADEFGFGDDYRSLGVYTQTLVNPYDMRGRTIELVQIYRETGRKAPLLMRFVATDLQYVEGRDHSFYSSKMVIFEKGIPVAAYPAIVEFFDYNTLDRVRLFFDDDGEDTTFLYDAVRKIIVKEEDTGIRRSEQYRRFEMLFEEDVYEVRFVAESLTIPAHLPDRIPTWTSQGKGRDVMKYTLW